MKLLAKLSGKRTADAGVEEAVLLEETFRERVDTDNALRSVSPLPLPDDLQLRLRLALSHERVRAERRWYGRVAHRFHLLAENTLRPFAMQGAIALAAVLVLAGVGVTLGAVTPQQAVEANDIPLVGFSAPHYLYAVGGTGRAVGSVDQAPLTVQARVDGTGHVYSYRVLSGSLTPETEAALRERMLTSIFKPASFFGEPVSGSVVLTFADVEVHG